MKQSVRTLRQFIALILMMGLFSGLAQADFAFRDLQGNIATLESQQIPGEWTVVMIWASGCHICNQEVGEYSKFHLKHAGEKANIVGISIDGNQGLAEANKFVQRNEVLFPSLIADVETVARWYEMRTGESFRATPTFVLIDGDGEVRAAQPGAVPIQIVEDFIAAKS